MKEIDVKMLPFELGRVTTFTPRKKIEIMAAKNMINAYFLLKWRENQGGKEFNFDKHSSKISNALALLLIEDEITVEKSEGIMKFLAYKQRERSYT